MPSTTRSSRLKRKADDVSAEEGKKYRDTIDSLAKEFFCPITLELPVEPVIAEDGRVYERRAIETWLRGVHPSRSPATNEPMGVRLLPAVQVRNSVESIVRSGALSGSATDAWKHQLEELDEMVVTKTRAKAEAGCGHAAWSLGYFYWTGMHGLEKDTVLAFRWFKRGAGLGNASATAVCGWSYATGDGVDKNVARAGVLLTQAAITGSASGCYWLGQAFAAGIWGLDKDEEEAKKWFTRMPFCPIQDLMFLDTAVGIGAHKTGLRDQDGPERCC